MITWCIIVGGCWWAAAETRNGWWLLMIVPAVAVLAASLAAVATSYALQEELGRTAFNAILQGSCGLIVGAIVAGVVRWRRRAAGRAALSHESA